MARIPLQSFLVALVLVAPRPAPAQAEDPPTMVFHPTTDVGSFGPDVYLDDITYTMRLNWFRSMTIDETNPDVAYVGSYDGYVFKTVDGGKTWDESRLIPERRPFYGDAGERVYFGRHRFNSDPGDPFGSGPPDKVLGLKRKDPFSFLRVGTGAGGGGAPPVPRPTSTSASACPVGRRASSSWCASSASRPAG